MSATVLVTGVGGPAGRALAAMLSERGARVVGVDMDPPPPGPGVPPAMHCVPPASDPGFSAALRGVARREGVDLVVPTVSEELPVLADEAHAWPVPVAVDASGPVVLAHDKWLTCRWLAAAEVAVPAHSLTADAAGWALVGAPALSKPRVSRGARGVVVYDEPPGPGLAPDLPAGHLLQEFLPGTEYAPCVVAGAPGGPVIVVLEKTALTRGDVGNALGVRRVHAPAVATLALEAVSALGLVGPADVDIRLDAVGVPRVIDVNARVGANLRHAPEVVDALLAMYLAPAGRGAARARP